MKRTLGRPGPTHADALAASRAVMMRALTQMAFYSPHEDVRDLASRALSEATDVYGSGVRRAVD